MKKVIAALGGFTLPAIVAGYVALAPLGGTFAPLDALALQITAVRGRDIAVLALLGVGVVLALFAVLLFGRNRAASDPAGQTPEDEQDPAWIAALSSPEPDFDRGTGPQDRLARSEEDGMTAERAPSFLAPVMLIRKPRQRERDWFADSSWLGGLPRLGDRAWPRDTTGAPLPFAAQIDLADLANATPGALLPTAGSLAFFLGTGAVVAVSDGPNDFTDPPADLPPAFDEGGRPFPATTSRLSRWFFPLWPVDLVGLDLPQDAVDGDEAAVADAMETQIQRHAALRDHPFYAVGVGAPVEALWWHSVIHLADQLQEALAACAQPIADRRAALERQLATLKQLQADPAADPDVLEDAQDTAEYLAEALEDTQAQCAALPSMVDALEGFIAGREPWVQLTAEELEVVRDILAEVHERFGEIVRGHVPGSLAQLATLTVRAMVSGPPEALAALPDAVLERLNAEYRLPPLAQHQMFGPPVDTQAARLDHREDILLLQLAYDDLMEWNWGEAAVFQFWISPEDAAAGNWQAARLTFEDGGMLPASHEP